MESQAIIFEIGNVKAEIEQLKSLLLLQDDATRELYQRTSIATKHDTPEARNMVYHTAHRYAGSFVAFNDMIFDYLDKTYNKLDAVVQEYYDDKQSE